MLGYVEFYDTADDTQDTKEFLACICQTVYLRDMAINCRPT